MVAVPPKWPLTVAGHECKSCARLGHLCAFHQDQNDEVAAPRCGARKPAGGLCRQPAGLRTPHPGVGRCFRHGGGSPGGIKNGQRLMAEAAVATYGLPREVGPHQALLEEVWRTAGHVAWLEERVRALDPDSLVWGVTKQVTESSSVEVVPPGEEPDAEPVEVPSSETTMKSEEAAATSIWIDLYHKERRHLTEVCKTAIACGIAERQVKLAEQHGAIIARVIVGVLGDLGVRQGDPEVRVAVRKHLALVSGE